jgi:flavin reductase (DIM6/NTAB) family NADH-FMN oxidoreductase RutF
MSLGVDPAAFRAAMARFPGAVTIVTALTQGGQRRGITATAVCSVSADPPTLLVCLNRKTGTCATVTDTGRFAVSLLAGDGGALALRFAGQGGISGAEKFEGSIWATDATGLPYLPEAVLAFSCRVTEAVEAHSHQVFLGQIEALHQGPGAALVYEQSRFHRLTPL